MKLRKMEGRGGVVYGRRRGIVRFRMVSNKLEKVSDFVYPSVVALLVCIA